MFSVAMTSSMFRIDRYLFFVRGPVPITFRVRLFGFRSDQPKQSATVRMLSPGFEAVLQERNAW